VFPATFGARAAGRVSGLGRVKQLGGVLAFTSGSVLCALAPSLAILVAGRVIQGAGAAVIVPASLGLGGLLIAAAGDGGAPSSSLPARLPAATMSA
jgi:predicted MFS family arabinose efflux permease